MAVATLNAGPPTIDLVAVGRGLVPGHSLISVLGHNDDIDTASTPEDIWIGGGQLTYPATAEVVSVVSDDITDTQQIAVVGLDANYDSVFEIVTLTGTTPVLTTQTFLRFRSAILVEPPPNAGTITCSMPVAGTQGVMLPGVSQTQLSHYTVPANHQALIYNRRFTITRTSAAQAAVVQMMGRVVLPGPPPVSIPFTVFDEIGLNTHGSGTVIDPAVTPLPETTDIKAACDYVSANNTEIITQIDMVLVDLAAIA